MDKNTSYTEKYQNHISCSFDYKFVYINNNFSKLVVLYRRKNTIYKLIEAILKEYDYCKQTIKKYFNESLIKFVEDKDFNQVINVGYLINYLLKKIKKLRGHDHITEKYNGSTHQDCNIRPYINESYIPLIFHNLKVKTVT